jgi:hypothetical protein
VREYLMSMRKRQVSDNGDQGQQGQQGGHGPHS